MKLTCCSCFHRRPVQNRGVRRTPSFHGVALVATLAVAASLLFAAGLEPVLTVTGDVPTPERYSLEQLQKLPVTKVTARDHDGTEAEYTGVAVAELLRRAGAPLGEKLRGPALAKTVLVHAADRYQAAFSLAELDPGMNDRPALLAWSRNNEPLTASQGPIRLVIPGDKRQARWVRQVTAIEIVSLNRPAITNAASSAVKP
jgi:DMSO/TMAO reductase YedYZ molybdopterin-dependent catalytic subunit